MLCTPSGRRSLPPRGTKQLGTINDSCNQATHSGGHGWLSPVGLNNQPRGMHRSAEHHLRYCGRLLRCGRRSTSPCELWRLKERAGENHGINAPRLLYMDSIHSIDWRNGDRSSPSTRGNPVITHGIPDSAYSMVVRVISSTGVVNGTFGAAQNVSLADRK